jgi:hypothetical protein
MTRSELHRAQRISEYVDGLVVYHRTQEEHAEVTQVDREFRQLTALATALSRIRVRPPAGLEEDLLRRLPVLLPGKREDTNTWLFSLWRRSAPGGRSLLASLGGILTVPRAIRAAAAVMLPLALTATLLWHGGDVGSASAAEILSLADATVTRLVAAGEVLYRQWIVVARIHDASGGPERIEERVYQEWMDGADFDHVAGRILTADGRLLLSYTKVREGGELRGHVYFAPGFSNEPRGLLSIEPSRSEFEKAASLFPPDERLLLRTYLARGYIYEPISGERRFNRTVLDVDGGSDALPRMRLSLEDAVLAEGARVYKVRVVDPVRVRFRWKSNGPPVAWLERRVTTRFISHDSYLTVGSEELQQFEDGRQVFRSSQLVETHTIKVTDGPSPFDLEVPKNTPVRRQSAFEQLSAVARVVARASTKHPLASVWPPGPPN